MPLKCVETIYHPSLWDEEIVHPLEKSWDKVHHQYHHRHGYRLGYPAKPAPGNRGRQHPNRCCDEYRPGRQVIAVGDPEGNREALGGVKCSLVPLCLPKYMWRKR